MENWNFLAFGKILVLVVAFLIKILIKKSLENWIFLAFGKILVLVVAFSQLKF